MGILILNKAQFRLFESLTRDFLPENSTLELGTHLMPKTIPYNLDFDKL